MRISTLRRGLGVLAVAAAFVLAAGAALVAAPDAVAADLKIAVAADVTSIDPHFFNLFPNNNIAEHIFDKLVQMDPDSKMIPGLATSWKTIDDTTWEFKLRKGVKFHDGSELTAEDVVFSIDRVLQRATELAMQDLGIMPIHFQFTMWATAKGVTYVPRTDEYTLAFQFKPVNK